MKSTNSASSHSQMKNTKRNNTYQSSEGITKGLLEKYKARSHHNIKEINNSKVLEGGIRS